MVVMTIIPTRPSTTPPHFRAVSFSLKKANPINAPISGVVALNTAEYPVGNHQSYMLRRGMELDRNHQALAEENTQKLCETLALVGIHVDNWMQPRHNRYFLEAVTKIYDAARDVGAIYSITSAEPYCSHCDKWGYEAFGRGLCNHCGVDSDASRPVEGGAHTPDAAKMKQFCCKLCGGEMAFLSVEREFLQLSAYHNFLQQLFSTKPLRPPMPQFLQEEYALGPQDWGITRPHDGSLFSIIVLREPQKK